MRADVDAMARAQASMKAELRSATEANELRALEIAQDRKRLSGLENLLHEVSCPKPQPKQENQAAILNMILTASEGHWLLIRDVRRKMSVTDDAFSRLLKIIPGVETKPDPTDGRRKLIRKKNKIA